MKTISAKFAACLILITGITSTLSAQWQPVGQIGFASGAKTSLAFSPSDEPFLAFNKYFSPGVALSVMKFDNNDWVNVGSNGDSIGDANSLSLAFSPSGEPYVAYGDYENSEKVTVKRFDGTSWVAVGAEGISTNTAETVSLAFSSSGEPFVAFMDRGNSDKASVMKFDGTNWVNVGASGFSQGAAWYLSLAVSPADEPHVAYLDWGNSQKATVMKFDGSNWVNVGNAGFSPGAAFSTTIRFSPNGEPFVAFQDEANSSKASVMKFDGSNWVNVGAAGFSPVPSLDGLRPLFEFNPSGEPMVAFKENGDNISLMKYDGTNWTTIGASLPNLGARDMSFAFSSNGVPHISYMENSTGGRIAVMKNDETVSIVDFIEPDNSIKTYPNPTHQTVYFSSPTNVKLINLSGQVIGSERQVNKLNLSNLASGIYFLIFTDNNGHAIQRNKVVKE